MAHYRRKRPSIRTVGNLSTRTCWSWPRWWDVLKHRRPRRREEAALLREVVVGRRDPDGIVWPLGNRKPHTYWW